MFGVTEESISREFYVTDDGEKSACLNPARVISEEMAKSGIYGNLSQMKRSASAVQWTGQQDMRHSKRHVTVTAHGPILTTQKIPVGRVTDGEWVTECWRPPTLRSKLAPEGMRWSMKNAPISGQKKDTDKIRNLLENTHIKYRTLNTFEKAVQMGSRVEKGSTENCIRIRTK